MGSWCWGRRSGDETNQEVEMSKRNETPTTPVRTSRLIVAGGAKTRTNATGGDQVIEELPDVLYNPN
jgi:hypothetical protein